MSVYTKYVEREADLDKFINDAVFTPSEDYYTGRDTRLGSILQRSQSIFRWFMEEY